MNLHTNKEFVAHCHTLIDAFLEDVDKVNFAFIATADGFAVASRFVRVDSAAHGEERLAAVSSSMMALGTSLAQEFGLKNCRTVTVDAGNGKILIHPVITPEQPFIFMVQAQSESLLGMIMHSIGKLDKGLIAKTEEMNSKNQKRENRGIIS